MNPVPWAADPHTKIKHALYRQYLSKWFPIMAAGWGGDITYAEGFSGPGIYTNGEPGSPVIALRTILDDRKLRTSSHKLRLLFVDKDPRCINLLKEKMSAAAEPVALSDLPKYGMTVDIVQGECVPALEQLLHRHDAWGRPMLVVLDTWGGAVWLDLVQKVAKNSNSEVLITIQPQYFSRFAGDEKLEHGDKVFGDKEWRKVREQPSANKARWLLQHYRETIRKCGFDYVLDFELVDENGHALYLVFGTTHRRGLEKMKEAMWEVDAVAGAGYRDPRDPDQQTLSIMFEPNTEPLRRLLIQHLRSLGDSGATVNDLRNFALFQTVFKASQVKAVVERMLALGQIESDTPTLKFQSIVRSRF
ncbi:three-Cys-motif partner protein TcmP [Rhodococcus erythropolis]